MNNNKTVTRVLFAIILIAVLIFSLALIHPGTGSSSSAVSERLDLWQRFDQFVSHTKSDALSNLSYIRKIYKLDLYSDSAPLPNQAAFGETNDPLVIQAIIDSASELLDGQAVAWSPDIHTFHNTPFSFYYDESILVIQWKELLNNKVCTFAEVRIADASQLRRKLAGDVYGSDVQLTASSMATDANAVVAINGDYYGFRNDGITVYKGNLYRFAPEDVDTCFFTTTGEMLFSHKGEMTSRESAEQFVTDNNVIFSCAFGPIIIENGRNVAPDYYSIGAANSQYSRSVIAYVDELHYLLMTINHDSGFTGTSVENAAEILLSKGVSAAYCLDGGQSSELIFNGTVKNSIDYNAERLLTDIVYFATALPETEN